MNRMDADVEVVRDISTRGYQDAIEILELIELLEAGNVPDIREEINRRYAGIGAFLIRISLLSRLHILVARAYPPVRKGDRHLRRAFNLLENSYVRGQLEKFGYAADLARAEELWRKISADKRLIAVRHLRDKELAHLGGLDPRIPKPNYNELFAIARATAAIMEKLAHGTGVITVEVEHQLNVPKKSIAAFWAIWKQPRPKRARRTQGTKKPRP